MATSLAQIRAKLQAQENNRNNNGPIKSADKTLFAHWNAEEGSTSRIRFLPDGNQNNPFFWVEKQMIKLPFPGIKGQPDSKPFTIQVPCIEMWEGAGKCPILSEVRTWFKDPNNEELGRKYWKKKTYLLQGFVRENSLPEDESPENPIRKFVFSPQVFNIVKAAILDPELEELPTHYDFGLDFQIVKSSKGGFADYSTSKWARKESALTPDETSAIDNFGLYNLSDWLPKRPTDVELKVMKEMFEASVDGELYDMERWGEYFRPFSAPRDTDNANNSTNTGNDVKSVAVKTLKTETVNNVSVTEDPPFDVEEKEVKSEPIKSPVSTANSKKAEDILQMIRNRNKQQ